jgi:hypothetical protein
MCSWFKNYDTLSDIVQGDRKLSGGVYFIPVGKLIDQSMLVFVGKLLV